MSSKSGTISSASSINSEQETKRNKNKLKKSQSKSLDKVKKQAVVNSQYNLTIKYPLNDALINFLQTMVTRFEEDVRRTAEMIYEKKEAEVHRINCLR